MQKSGIKNIIWGDIAQQLSKACGTERTKDNIAKKWSNILAKYKPIISNKMIYVRKTGVVHLRRICQK